MKFMKSQKISEEIELFPRKFGKTAFLLKPADPRSPLGEGYIVFETAVRPVVLVFALTPDKKVIAVRQYRYAAEQEMIEVPGGVSDEGERPEEAARRELEEETGFVAGSIIPLTKGAIWLDPASVRTPFLPYLARECRASGARQPVADEECEVIIFPWEEWIAQIQRGEILDAKTIAITYLALPHVGT